MSEECKKIHQLIEQLPLIRIGDDFDFKTLPIAGIYFFYEKGEYSDHFPNCNRIVRVGTHRKNNFQTRIKDHYLDSKKELVLDKAKSAPHDRSIFRNHIGRCLLNMNGDSLYIKNVWKINKTPKIKNKKCEHLRDINKELGLEKEISRILRQQFSFRYIILDDEKQRMGEKSMESALIATIAQCKSCMPSTNWLGNNSPEDKIKNSGMWNMHHVNARIIDENQFELLKRAVEESNLFYDSYNSK